jgi:hypothetical protein
MKRSPVQQIYILLTSTLVALFVQTPVTKHRTDLFECSCQPQYQKHVRVNEISWHHKVTGSLLSLVTW